MDDNNWRDSITSLQSLFLFTLNGMTIAMVQSARVKIGIFAPFGSSRHRRLGSDRGYYRWDSGETTLLIILQKWRREFMLHQHDPEEGCNSMLCVVIKATVPP